MITEISFSTAAERIMIRAIEDAVSAALPDVLEHRAAVLEWARPRPDDFRGRATDADLQALDARCAASATALRNAAALARLTRPWWLDHVLHDEFGSSAPAESCLDGRGWAA